MANDDLDPDLPYDAANPDPGVRRRMAMFCGTDTDTEAPLVHLNAPLITNISSQISPYPSDIDIYISILNIY